MAALKCEICGGGLIGKPGGVFECEYCGVKYDTSWAKAKICGFELISTFLYCQSEAVKK